MTGIEAAEIIYKKYGTPVIFLTGQSDESTVEKAKVSAPFGYLIKPVDDRALKISINMALYKNALDANVKKQEAIIRALLNATTDAFFIIDNQGTLLGLNEALAKKAGKTVNDLLNTTVYELIPQNVISTALAEEIRAALGGKPGRLEEERRSSTTGGMIPISSPYRTKAGRLPWWRYSATISRSGSMPRTR